MSYSLSAFGERLDESLGTLRLMRDLGDAAEKPDNLMLGGGNPARIAAVEEYFVAQLQREAQRADQFIERMAVYADPTGDREFRRAIVTLLNREYGFGISMSHVCLTNGSQNGFFALMNMLGGRRKDGSVQRILLPITPEYLGYADLWVDEAAFAAHRPAIELLDGRLFKYRVDFDKITVAEDIGAICLSRPTNPTGNVLTDGEMLQLDRLAQESGVPLIVDCAYGDPFPGITRGGVIPRWNENTVLCMSLSKIGLPSVRTGIIVAHPSLVEKVAALNAVMNLAPGNIGPALMTESIASGEILEIASNHIQPYYETQSEQAVAALLKATEGTPVRLHKPEGAIFLWLWAPDLPTDSERLYRELKAAGVIVVAGHHFFPGLDSDWPHQHECLRISFAPGAKTVERAAPIIGAILKDHYA